MKNAWAWIGARSGDRRWSMVLSGAMALFYGWQSVKWATRNPYIVQDDVRQHVFWAFRYLDPGLFPGDWIADYYQSVAPLGYQWLYHGAALLGWDPLTVSKYWPVILGLVTTALTWRVMIRLLPVPWVALLGCILVNQSLWMEDDLASSTPRAFATPLVLAVMDALLSRSLWGCLGAIALSGLFYPMVAVVAAAALAVNLGRRWWATRRGRSHPEALTPLDWRLAIGGIAMAVAVLLPELLTSSEFGPVISRSQAAALPEFNFVGNEYGRSFFFHPNPLIFWLFAPRSGFLWVGFVPPIALAALALPRWLSRPARARQFPLASSLSPHFAMLGDWVWGGLGLFLAAHALLFRLYLPNRYGYVPLRVVLPVAGAIALGLWLDRQMQATQPQKPRWFWPLVSLVLSLSIVVPMVPNLAVSSQLQMEGRMAEVYEFLQKQPKDILVVSLSKEADFIPIFARRSILASREFALPYHWGYYRVLRQRIEDTIRAQYTSNLSEVKAFLRKYQVNFWLLEPWSLSKSDLADNTWLQQFQPLIQDVSNRLDRGEPPALERAIAPCSVLENKRLQLLDARCILQLPSEP
ncbi:MAG: hypothetical protein ACAF42_13365 [Limnothrix sp. BL-A-16]